jgi:hypothetical protein
MNLFVYLEENRPLKSLPTSLYEREVKSPPLSSFPGGRQKRDGGGFSLFVGDAFNMNN